jgi:hypothetical protein
VGLQSDRPEEAIRRAAEHVEATRRRLREGADEVARQRGSVADTAEHLSGMSRWIEQTRRELARGSRPDPDAA